MKPEWRQHVRTLNGPSALTRRALASEFSRMVSRRKPLASPLSLHSPAWAKRMVGTFFGIKTFQ